MTIRALLAMAITAASLSAHAAQPTLPSNLLKSAPSTTELSIPPIDVPTLADEDSKARGQAMRYGMPQRVDRPLISAGHADLGEWQTQADGRLLWSTRIESAQAVSLDLHFSRFVLPAGAELYLADASGEYVLGPIRGSDALVDQQYYTALIPGDVMRVDVIVPAAKRAQVDLQLASVTYGYRGLFGRADHPDAVRSGSCNVDVACPLGDDWSDQIDGVGQYIFQDGGSFVCTGTLIANTAGTPVPYFMTANHCVSSNTVANTMRVYWNYQSATCRAPGSGASGSPLPRPATFSNGATLRATYAANDSSLVELNAAVPADQDPYFVGWDRRNLATPSGPGVSGAITIHHPSGHEKRISRDADALTVTSYLSNTVTPTGSHYRIGNWEEGTTEGGSSGSALFSADKRLIGTLHGGFASCTSNTSDWYGRIHQSWAGGGTDATRLSTWLDPEGTAPETFDGYRGGPASEADVSLAMTTAPDPVDIGETVTLSADVANAGPDAATGVEVVIDLPTGLAFTSGTGAGWTCAAAGATVTCDLTGNIASGASAAGLDVLADVNATEVGTVTITGAVSADGTDGDTSNNEVSVDLEITGEPPLPDAIFCSGFEEGEDGSCGTPADPDVVFVDDVNFAFPNNGIGGSINWLTEATCGCDAGDYNFNVWNREGVLAFYFPINLEGDATSALVSDGNGLVSVLDTGATIGPQSAFEFGSTETYGTIAAAWRQPTGVDGYIGFQFFNTSTSEINYGYAQLTTTGTTGYPATLVRYWYNSAGDPITIQ